MAGKNRRVLPMPSTWVSQSSSPTIRCRVWRIALRRKCYSNRGKRAFLQTTWVTLPWAPIQGKVRALTRKLNLWLPHLTTRAKKPKRSIKKVPRPSVICRKKHSGRSLASIPMNSYRLIVNHQVLNKNNKIIFKYRISLGRERRPVSRTWGSSNMTKWRQ